MNYDQAFDATLRPRHGLLSVEEIRAAERRRQGRLLRDDPECYAVADAFKLHRAHFRRASRVMLARPQILKPEPENGP